MVDELKTDSNFPQFVHEPVAKSAQEMASRNTFGRYSRLARHAIQGYIASFLDSEGANRHLFDVADMGYTVNYVTDESYDPSEVGDDGKRHIQLTRMFHRLKQKIPAILIIDGGVNPIPSGLGDWGRGVKNASGINELQLEFVGNVPLEITVVAADPTMADKLREVMLSIFGAPLRALGGGWQINSTIPGSNWVVILPLEPPSMSGINNAQMGDSAMEKFHYFNFSMELRVEDSRLVAYRMDIDFQTLGHAACTTIPIPDPDNPLTLLRRTDLEGDLDSAYPMTLLIPSSIPLGIPIPSPSLYTRPEIEFYVNRPDIATIDVENGVVTGKRRGVFTIYVRFKQTGTVVTSKEITVV